MEPDYVKDYYDDNLSDYYIHDTMDYCATGNENLLTRSKIFQEVFLAIVCLVGFVGNSLVIYVVVRFSKMQTVTNIYIVNLAIADACSLSALPLAIVTMLKKSWIFGAIPCKAYHLLLESNGFTSTFFLFIMCVDCYYVAVCHPISSPKFRTPFISCIVSMVTWLCNIVLVIPYYTLSTESKYMCIDAVTKENITITSCHIDSLKLFSSHFAYEMYCFVFSYVIPLSLILVFYCLVSKRLKTVGEQNEEIRSHRKVTKLVFSMVAIHVCCWTPFWIMKLVHITDVYYLDLDIESNLVLALYLLASCLSIANLAMNPILYAFLSDNFKKSFLDAFLCSAGKVINEAYQRQNEQVSTNCRNCPTKEDECDLGPLLNKGKPSTSTARHHCNVKMNNLKLADNAQDSTT